MGNPNALSPAEHLTLAQCEGEIEAGFAQLLRAWRQIGQALWVIDSQRLYREWASTFSEYVSARWGLSKSTAYEWISASKVVANLEDAGVEPPTKIKPAKVLARLPSSQQAPAMREAQALANGNGHTEPTTFEVMAVVAVRMSEPPPRPSAEVQHDREQRAICRHICDMWLRVDEDRRKGLIERLMRLHMTDADADTSEETET